METNLNQNSVTKNSSAELLQEKIVKSILSDSILLNRANAILLDFTKSIGADSECSNFINRNIIGYDNALFVMGISNNDNIYSKLEDIYFKEEWKGREEKDPYILAGYIYDLWLREIKNYFLNLKKLI